MNLRLLSMIAVAAALGACSNNGSTIAPPPPAVNQAPTISQADDINTASQTPATVTVSVTDDADLGQLTVGATSDNEAVVSAAAVVITGDGGDRDVTVTPDGAQLGTAVVTLTATDAEGATASSMFTVTVTAQTVSFQTFSRAVFADDANADPRNVNVLAFDQDAEGDDFADLINP